MKIKRKRKTSLLCSLLNATMPVQQTISSSEKFLSTKIWIMSPSLNKAILLIIWRVPHSRLTVKLLWCKPQLKFISSMQRLESESKREELTNSEDKIMKIIILFTTSITIFSIPSNIALMTLNWKLSLLRTSRREESVSVSEKNFWPREWTTLGLKFSVRNFWLNQINLPLINWIWFRELWRTLQLPFLLTTVKSQAYLSVVRASLRFKEFSFWDILRRLVRLLNIHLRSLPLKVRLPQKLKRQWWNSSNSLTLPISQTQSSNKSSWTWARPHLWLIQLRPRKILLTNTVFIWSSKSWLRISRLLDSALSLSPILWMKKDIKCFLEHIESVL